MLNEYPPRLHCGSLENIGGHTGEDLLISTHYALVSEMPVEIPPPRPQTARHRSITDR